MQSITSGINGADEQGWVNVSDNVAADQILAAIGTQKYGCSNGAPFADALCQVSALGELVAPHKKLKVITVGQENASTGPCSGPEGVHFNPWDPGSWQFNVLGAVNSSKWVVDPTIFRSVGGSGTALDPQLANYTGGKLVVLYDNMPIGANVGPSSPAPAGPPWSLAALAALLGSLGIAGARRHRSRTV